MDEEEAAFIVTDVVRRVGWMRVFGRLKSAIIAAELVYADEFLAALCPAEAEILSDPTLTPTIRFRFGGTGFPPIIYFKIFLKRAVTTVNHFNAHEMLSATSQAAQAAYSMMGHDKYMEQVLEDEYLHSRHGLTDITDVTDSREYQQLMSLLDARSASQGGKANNWRPVASLGADTDSKVVQDFVDHVKKKGNTDFALTRKELDAKKLIPDHMSLLRADQAYHAIQKAAGPRSSRLQARDKKKKMAKLRRAYLVRGGNGKNADLVLVEGDVENDLASMPPRASMPTKRDGMPQPIQQSSHKERAVEHATNAEHVSRHEGAEGEALVHCDDDSSARNVAHVDGNDGMMASGPEHMGVLGSMQKVEDTLPPLRAAAHRMQRSRYSEPALLHVGNPTHFFERGALRGHHSTVRATQPPPNVNSFVSNVNSRHGEAVRKKDRNDEDEELCDWSQKLILDEATFHDTLDDELLAI